MIRLKPFGLVLVLATVALPAAAVIVQIERSYLPVTTFGTLNTLDNSELDLGGGARASSLFAGQGWAYSDVGQDEWAPWESPVGSPVAGTNLALIGQYPPVVPVPPGPSPAVDTTSRQNVYSPNFPPGSGLLDRFGGSVNGVFYGVTSILFETNINTFSTGVLDAGINPGDNLGGPLWLAFYGRTGELLQDPFLFPRAETGQISFRSSEINIAGLQIWHQDPRGLAFRTVQFGIELPEPTTLGLVLLGLAASLGLSKRQVRQIRGKQEPTQQVQLTARLDRSRLST